MWSDLDKQIIEFVKELEAKLSNDDDLKDDLPLDNLQTNISLEQQSNPPVVSWNITVQQGLNKIFNVGCVSDKEQS